MCAQLRTVCAVDLKRTTGKGWLLASASACHARGMPFQWVGVALCVFLFCVSQDAPASDADAGASGGRTEAPEATYSDPRVPGIRALVDGTLDVSVSPQSLFDVSLIDEVAIEVEAERLALLLAVPSDSKAKASPQPGTARSIVDARAWRERLELDSARLAFYSLDRAKRAEVLAAHAARQAASAASNSGEPADVERVRALEAAKAARLEAEQGITLELDRLARLEQELRTLQQRFVTERAELTLRRDLVLGWQRRVRDAKAADDLGADATYDGLLRQLRTSRDELLVALNQLDAPSEVPSLGPDVLLRLPLDIPTDQVRTRRLNVERAAAEVKRDEAALREERTGLLLDEITTLNWERLGLFAHLTQSKREAVTGFTLAGWDQALAEAEHVVLIFRYHRHIAWQWFQTVRRGDTGGSVPWRLLTFGVPLLGAIVVFIWARRRLQALSKILETRVQATERVRHSTAPSPGRYLLRLWLKTHGPLEWMLFFAVIFELLPTEAMELIEVQVVASVITWTLVGALVVNTINALAAGRTQFASALQEDPVGELRLRSLRLVGGMVVGFGLTLVLCERLVGEGTIYNWLSASSVLAALVVFLVLVRWWRGTVFERLDQVRKKTPLQAWLLANRSGWQSFLAAMVGALQLFAAGTWRVARSWVSGFDIARRVHAYLFKREIERLGDGAAEELSPLAPDALASLHPEAAWDQWIACPADRVVDAVAERCREWGGILAVHGARGMGKTSLLRSVQARCGASTLFTCDHATTLDSLRDAVQARVPVDESETPRVVLLDDCQTLIRSCIGGLERFDEVIAWIRSTASTTTWVLAFDASLWPLLQRARDSRPLFDESFRLAPWTENQIGALLLSRSERAQVSPTYVDLLDKLPPGADEVERQEALNAKRAGYQRMLWDHVGGNPGLALEAWRASLARDDAGVVRVRPLQVPDVAPLEQLPDPSLFVLRAVLQLAPTTVDAVALATRLRPEEVLVDFRVGKTRGYFEERDGRVRVAWFWLCAVVQLLERRRLLGVT